MNYTAGMEKACDCNNAPQIRESMTDMMRETSAIAADVLNMVRRINAHLFGSENTCCEKEADPKCFKDELQKTRSEILATAEELSRMSNLLGV